MEERYAFVKAHFLFYGLLKVQGSQKKFSIDKSAVVNHWLEF